MIQKLYNNLLLLLFGCLKWNIKRHNTGGFSSLIQWPSHTFTVSCARDSVSSRFQHRRNNNKIKWLIIHYTNNIKIVTRIANEKNRTSLLLERYNSTELVSRGEQRAKAANKILIQKTAIKYNDVIDRWRVREREKYNMLNIYLYVCIMYLLMVRANLSGVFLVYC